MPRDIPIPFSLPVSYVCHSSMTPDRFRTCWMVMGQWLQGPMNMMTSSNGNIFRVTGHLCVEFTCPRWIPHTQINGWVNNGEAGDLRRYRAHYDVTVMINAGAKICWHLETRLPDYEVQFFTAQTPNHWRKWKGRASVPKNGIGMIKSHLSANHK